MNSGWKAVAEAIEARILELGTSYATIARGSGVDAQTWRALRKGERTSYSVATIGGVTRALAWTPDSIDRIVSGRQPLVVPSSSATVVDLSDLNHRDRLIVLSLVEAFRASTPSLS